MAKTPELEGISGSASEQDLILATKLYIPKTSRQYVNRDHLLKKLDQGLNSRLVLVSAPPGYGKTTSVSLWLSALANPRIKAAWVSLDEGDNDPARFLTYFITAIMNLDIGVGENSLALLQSAQASSVDSVLLSLLNEIAESEDDFVLVIDDYHLVETSAIHDALVFLIDNMPTQMHLVLISRSEPPLSLARLRARGQLTEIHTADLRFTPQEVAEFLNTLAGLGLSPQELAAMEARTEGWVTGLQLAALSIEGQHDRSAFIQGFSGDDRYILDYLADEVLNRQPQNVQSFLIKTSILNRLTGSLCDAITGQEDGQETLKSLEIGNLFLVPLDNNRTWYRYHTLFADFLRQRLGSAHADEITSLHNRASQWFEGARLISESIEHAIAATDYDRAALLIESISESVWLVKGSTRVLAWLDELPRELIRSRPRLYLNYAWMLLANGQFAAVEIHLSDEGEFLNLELQNLPDLERKSILAELAAIRANLACYQGDIQRSIESSLEALELLPGEKSYQRNLITTNIAFYLRGEVDPDDRISEATRLLAQATTAGDLMTALASNNLLAAQLYTGGRLHEAEIALNQTLKFAERRSEVSDQSSAAIQALAFTGLGDLKREWNELDLALRYSEEGVRFAEGGEDDITLLNANLILARVLMTRAESDRAFEIQEKAERISNKVAHSPDMAWIITQTAGFTARLWLGEGRVEAAARWARAAGLDITKDIDYRRINGYITLARVRMAEQKLDTALELLVWLRENLENSGLISNLIEVLVLQSMSFQLLKKSDQAIEVLERTLTLAEGGGYLRIFLDEGRVMKDLLRQAIESDYVERLLEEFADLDETSTITHGIVEPLSARELEVLKLLAGGLSNHEIGNELFVTTNTVKWHLKNIFAKLGVHNRTQAVDRARELGLLKG
jgi:LuxR family maltose regulon positive regulatory protein